MADREKKQPFTVWEVQEVTEWRAFRYELRASDFEDAVKRVRAGEALPRDEGYVGETDFGESGFALRRTDAVEELDRVLAAKESNGQPNTTDHAEGDQDA